MPSPLSGETWPAASPTTITRLATVAFSGPPMGSGAPFTGGSSCAMGK